MERHSKIKHFAKNNSANYSILLKYMLIEKWLIKYYEIFICAMMF